MRAKLPDEIERQRTGGEPGSGPHGSFSVACEVTGRRLTIVASDGREWGQAQEPPSPEELKFLKPAQREYLQRLYANGPIVLTGPIWEHVSVSRMTGMSSWEEMCWVKGVFFKDSECVVEYHPPKSDYVNVHNNCLHLWRCPELEFPMPPKVCV